MRRLRVPLKTASVSGLSQMNAIRSGKTGSNTAMNQNGLMPTVCKVSKIGIALTSIS